jgi:glycosyltransferase involved in cell wall biosynthesis
MAMQRAVVATDVGGNNELIRDGATGLLVPPGDPQALCDAILRLLADPSLRASLGANAREFVSKDYSESSMISRYEALYRSLVSAKQFRK